MKKFVYQFKEASQLDCDRRALFGGKGANLAEMTKLGMPVPQGFTITTEACTQYYLDGEKISDGIQAEIMENIAKLEKLVGKEFGSLDNPLLVSVRSGARASMPGMMDTILNLGLNDEVVVRFAEKTGNPRFAYDSYRRFIQMYSDVVMEVGKKYFEQLIDEMKEKKGVKLDTELDADDLKALAEQFKAEYKAKIGKDFPQDPKEQLMGAVKAVFRSWNNDRAVYYRRMNDIPGDWGTAVNVQMMVFGNCDLVDEGMLDEKQALLSLDPKQLDALLHPRFDEAAYKKAKPIGRALPASPGAACGKVVFTAEDATDWVVNKGEKRVVLVRLETSPEDIEGMHYAQGILTVRGGMTSHAAVVARGMGTCCVSGCGDININEEKKVFTLGGKTFHEGDWISLNGSTGEIFAGELPTVEAELSGYFGRIMEWTDKYRALHVRTNADTPRDARQARTFGAEGIGLCRTEHMFFEPDRIMAMREMIVSDTVEKREKALAKLLPMQQGDFEALYEALEGTPVTIRFLDPPLHEFVPTEEADIKALAKDMDMTVDAVKAVITGLHEFNPMMGHRGCRLAVTYPEIAVMQTKAVMQAAIAVQKKHPDWKMVPEIMIPLVGEVKELAYVKGVVVSTADKCLADAGVQMKYKVGTMIEIPRAALTADAIATEAEFFSFGTNDLTQMTFGFSRDDAGKFLNAYYEKKIYESDPFARLDQIGVGKLVKMAAELGRATRPDIHLGICGEHGGDPSTIEFCHNIGLDYVSCSPYRVPIARLAAAQANIKNPRK